LEIFYHPTEELLWKKTVYNPDGSSKENTTYITQTFVRVTNGSGTFDYTYVYQNGQLVAQSVNGTKLFMVNDHKGNVVAVTNTAGVTVENTSYTPYGAIASGGTQSKKGYEGKEPTTRMGIFSRGMATIAFTIASTSSAPCTTGPARTAL
jgi:hypothetical protein